MYFSHKTSKAIPSSAVEVLSGELTSYIASLRRIVELGGYTAP